MRILLSTPHMSISTFSEPFTPRGVAAFARGSFSRLLLAQCIVASLAAAALAWFLHDACFAAIGDAIQNLPATGEIRSGQLDWCGRSPQRLAEGKFLALDVDLDHSRQIRSTADFQIEFGRETVRVFSLFGYTDFFYAPDGIAPFNRADLEPLWNAWRGAILFLVSAAIFVALPAAWWILATIYFLPVWVVGFFANRDLPPRAAWKLSSAALLPGALLMAAATLLYRLEILDLISLIFLFAAHFVLGWIYLTVGLVFVPPISAPARRENPFKL